ncbi:MAG: hypothetical protein PVJ01_04170, partial [Pseudomonadota bacterium]
SGIEKASGRGKPGITCTVRIKCRTGNLTKIVFISGVLEGMPAVEADSIFIQLRPGYNGHAGQGS